ncbi:MAG TPA: alpha/beta hydrolase [Telmatospirillum sp.]|nr:alpha/beta hydrolase [Telmatospirillum sp.]
MTMLHGVVSENPVSSVIITGLVVAIAAYLLVVAALAIAQRKLLYRPPPTSHAPQTAGITGMAAIYQNGALLGWYAPPPTENAPVLVFFHGNRGTLARVAAKTAPWRIAPIGIFAATYAGYEGNPGRPSETQLYADGRMVLDWLTRSGISKRRIILYGESLGTGIVTQLACEQAFLAIVLEAPFSSITDVAAVRYPWLPCRWLLRDRFDSLSKISRITSPLLILHGGADRTVPVEHARALVKAAPRTQLVIVAEAGHLNLHDKGATAPLLAFIDAL